jgi:hypothetical protein
LIHFNSARYDTARYVAKDGGDALTGTSAINSLVQGKNYNVTDGKGGPVVGNVTWNQDAKGGYDKCVDVVTKDGAGADIQVKLLENVEVKCVDNNKGSNLEMSVCFNWRYAATDGLCTLPRYDSVTIGQPADAYPGTPSKCFCKVVDVPTITVINLTGLRAELWTI